VQKLLRTKILSAVKPSVFFVLLGWLRVKAAFKMLMKLTPGHIAKRFGDLVRDMWAPNAKAIAPIKLRWTIGRYSTNFSGFQQQDSQVLHFLISWKVEFAVLMRNPN